MIKDVIIRKIRTQRAGAVTPYRGRASAVFCFSLIIVTMIAQALAYDPCPMKAVRP